MGGVTDISLATEIKELISANEWQMKGADPLLNEPWEQPIPFDGIVAPDFPIEHLPDILSNYVRAVSEATQTPVDMAAVASLAVIAVCVQRKYKIEGKPDWIEPLNLYSVVVASPAERKSAVLNHLTKYLYEYECTTNKANEQAINRNRSEKRVLERELEILLAKTVKNPDYKSELLSKQDELTKFKTLKPLRLLADDVSPEALTSLLAANDGKISVISAEGGIFEILSGRYSKSVNIDVFLKAHCGDAIRVDRKGRESELIPDPCMTVLLSIQPQVLGGLISNEIFRGRGLTARFLYCIPNSKLGRRKFDTEEIPEECKTRYEKLCYNLLENNNMTSPQILKLSPEAYTLSAAFAEALEPRLKDDLEGISDFAGKLHGAILRIAGILHLVKQHEYTEPALVSGETMQSAIIIGEYFLEHAKAAYNLMGANQTMVKAQYILQKLRDRHKEHSNDYISKRNLIRLCRKFKTMDELTAPLALLADYGYIQEINGVSPGGKKQEAGILVNPIFLSSAKDYK